MIMASKLFSGKVFLLVTGASQGIGRKIAQVLTASLEEGSHVLLIARNEKNLKETAEQIPKHVIVNCKSADLSKITADQLKDMINESIGANGPDQFDEAIIVHNVGSLGDITKATVDMVDFAIWNDYYNLNVFSPVILNGVFMKAFKNESIKKHVINITSLCGIKATKSLGYYCSGKASREMIFKIFALENPDVNVLNYSPGPVETDMLQILTDKIDNEEFRSFMTKLRGDKKSLTTDQTVTKLIQVLSEKKYQSGDHIDYYDDL